MVNAGVPLASTSFALVGEKAHCTPLILGEIGSLVEGFKVEATRTTENSKGCLKKTIMSLKNIKDCEILGSYGVFFL